MQNPFLSSRSSQKLKEQSFLEALQMILEQTKKTDEIKVEQILEYLSNKRYAALLVILSIPFCFPIQIPGFSTPFGLILGFLGLRMAFAKHLWWPKWILKKSIKSEYLGYFIKKVLSSVRFMQKIIHPRLCLFAQSPFFHRLNGLIIFIQACFLSLPLPIPLTNLIAALPILCMGLGLLENDGGFILLGYFLAFICLLFFGGLFFFGLEYINYFFNHSLL